MECESRLASHNIRIAQGLAGLYLKKKSFLIKKRIELFKS